MKTKLSKLETFGWCCAVALMLSPIAFVIAQSLPISRFPNTPTPNDSDLFVLAQTQAPATNKNIRYDQLRGAIRSGMATEAYVNFASNFLAANAGFARLEVQTNSTRLGLVTNLNWTYGVTGSVSGTTAILGVDDSLSLSNLSNNISTTITVTSNFLATSSIDVKTNQTMLILQDTPVSGSQWYVGTNGTPVTNDTRSGFEVNVVRKSMRMGQLADGIHPSNLGGQATNYWNDTNLLGPVTSAIGSNVTVRAAYSSIGGGAMNLILTNSKYSVISGGYNNIIDTNSPTSTIGGGGFNQIYGTPTTANNLSRTISGGTNNIINGAITSGSFIGGGGDNSIEAQFGVVSGGFANGIENTATPADYAFIGGGANNHVGENGGSDSSSYGVVCGGNANRARGIGSFVGGGNNNNLLANDDDYSTIVGGQNNDIGIAAGESESKYSFIGGGLNNDIANDCTHSAIVGGADNGITGGNTNSFIGGGRFNSISVNKVFAVITGGERNTVNGNHSWASGTSNTVTADRAHAYGTLVTNSTAGTVTIGELISYNTPSVIAGAGSGSTNYTLQVTSPKMVLGSSNVNIVAVMQTITGKTHNWSVNITNLSADTWGITFSSATNRWKFQSWMYGTNAPSVLTNNTLLRLQGESEGTNTLVTYQYFSPAL